MTRSAVTAGILLAIALLAAVVIAEDKRDEEGKPKSEPLRTYYRNIAAKYEFFSDAAREQPLKFVEKPVMKWANDDDWSGDVFVWMRGETPEVIGCVLTGPTEPKGRRIVFQEFHLLAEQ